jgi:hypothetical protein
MSTKARNRWLPAVGAALLVGIPAFLSAVPVDAATPSHALLSVRVFASGTGTMTLPDDITALDGRVIVAWQNGVGSMGEPSSTGATASTVVAYSRSGHPVASWNLTGKVDGMTADAASRRLIATVNEDGRSSIYTITPSAPASLQVRHFTYNLQPLPHGGGTDSIAVYHGDILISASAPTSSNVPAVYRVHLEAGGTAIVQPVFFDNSWATIANVNSPSHGQQVALALTDPDSSEIVPASSPRFAGDFVLDSQGDDQQIYVDGAHGPLPKLHLLDLSQSVDDTAWATDSDGTLYVTDGTDNEVFAVRGGFDPGTAYVAVTPGNANVPINQPNYLGVLDLRTGAISPAVTTIQAKGLVFMP